MSAPTLELTPSTTSQLPRSRIFSYALGDVANNLSFQLTSMFLMIYMTDIVGISAGVAGTIYAITKIWAGVADLIAGSTVDRARTRWGRLRPWLLWCSTPLAVVFVLLFSVPAGLSPAASVAWIFLFDALFQLFYSFVNIPYGSLSAAMTQDSVDRSRLSGARAIASALTGVGLAAVVAPQFKDTAADGVRLTFTLTTIVLGAIALGLHLVCFRNTREVVPRGTARINLRNTLVMVRRNRPLLVLCLGALFLLAANFTMNAVAMYYTRYVLGNASWFTWLMLAQTVGTIAAASLVPTLTMRWGKRRGYIGFAAVAVIAYLLVFLVPGGEGSLFIAMIAWLLLGIGMGGTNALMFAMQADTVDYGEWRTGIRSEGGSYSILSFVRKVGQGVGGAVGGAVVGAFGYVAQAPSQSAHALTGIKLSAGLVPAGLAVLAALVIIFYPLTADQHRSLVRELSDRRTRAAAAEQGVDEVTITGVGDGRDTMVTVPPATLGAQVPPIVTIFAQYGSGASVIAPAVAERLGVRFIGQAFSHEQIADPTGRSDNPGIWDRFLQTFQDAGSSDSEISRAAHQSLDHTMVVRNTDELLAGVQNGAVVLGHNGQAVLARAVGALHVRLTSPVSMRTQRVAYLTGLPEDQALARLRNDDRLRAEMSIRLHQVDPNDDTFYDLVLNTATFTFDQAVDAIVDVYRTKYPTAVL
ncbi:cytidylate kinase family protein [Aestuariimicrobium sp. T2.26MG-19.2B]|uniref:cytidylate kinase family protein n=1 Tax=Aestuariimicrobium sp. T2.26MG-19.2B TaxID=3040679 RepID=UPI002477446D|nr:cytidylate kinase family protein [Aestuariimicrobium sp. T2.26MG-19.2B]CAI9410232.1 Cytidylate kinase [Aestuariimicrobium sp. T2.26MG-19.2B]